MPFRQDELMRVCDFDSMIVFSNQSMEIDDQVTFDIHVEIDGEVIIEQHRILDTSGDCWEIQAMECPGDVTNLFYKLQVFQTAEQENAALLEALTYLRQV
jgi:hypothetical protein